MAWNNLTPPPGKNPANMDDWLVILADIIKAMKGTQNYYDPANTNFIELAKQVNAINEQIMPSSVDIDTVIYPKEIANTEESVLDDVEIQGKTFNNLLDNTYNGEIIGKKSGDDLTISSYYNGNKTEGFSTRLSITAPDNIVANNIFFVVEGTRLQNMLQTNTEYYLYFTVSSNNFSNIDVDNAVYVSFPGEIVNYVNKVDCTYKRGLNIVKITTKGTLPPVKTGGSSTGLQLKLTIPRTPGTDMSIHIADVMLLKLPEALSTIKFIKKCQTLKTVNIKTIGENLFYTTNFNKDASASNWILSSQSQLSFTIEDDMYKLKSVATVTGGVTSTEEIYVESGADYKISLDYRTVDTTNGSNRVVLCYQPYNLTSPSALLACDSMSFDLPNSSSVIRKTFKFKIPEGYNKLWIRILISKPNTGKAESYIYFDKIRITKGSNTTPEEYKDCVISQRKFDLNESLKSAGAVVDHIAKRGNEYSLYRNIKTIKFTDIVWSYEGSNANTCLFTAKLPSDAKPITSVNQPADAECNWLSYNSSSNISSSSTIGFYYTVDNKIGVRMGINSLISKSLEGFIEWCTTNDVELYYATKTQVIEPITDVSDLNLRMFKSGTQFNNLSSVTTETSFVYSANVGSSMIKIKDMANKVLDSSVDTITGDLKFDGSKLKMKNKSIRSYKGTLVGNTYEAIQHIDTDGGYKILYTDVTRNKVESTFEMTPNETILTTRGTINLAIGGNTLVFDSLSDTKALYTYNPISLGDVGHSFKEAHLTNFIIYGSGPTANRPKVPAGKYGMYYDLTISKQIWWNGTRWTDSTGTMV